MRTSEFCVVLVFTAIGTRTACSRSDQTQASMRSVRMARYSLDARRARHVKHLAISNMWMQPLTWSSGQGVHNRTGAASRTGHDSSSLTMHMQSDLDGEHGLTELTVSAKKRRASRGSSVASSRRYFARKDVQAQGGIPHQ
ncbi:hypothetical protein M409DRAFT_54423 [Zasmidium cellare ATCC 36951]|uniref:Secreted protein n=1 Tax=Zasmidium cellare ATCC 36951 TaxID=1080233 RepID=A0A6A6CJ25_ZASCE|nr:uncharacterized protein M409DRAFT_54423 [Zasmidium cellare ATCC 36951]KAF2167237.1 hypothetical protein M409DRAFT_54423 [Zasmidium cellare ATCC 36951]